MASTPNFNDGTWNIASTLNIGGDPNGDILWQNIANQKLVLWQQDGNVTTTVLELPSLNNFEAVVVGDFDGDGIGDPWLRNGESNKILLSSTDTIVDMIGSSYNPVVATDLNGDGNDDPIRLSLDSSKFSSWLMDGATFTYQPITSSGYANSDQLLSAFNGESFNTFDSLWFDSSANNFNITSYDIGVRTITNTFTVSAGNEFINSGDYSGDGNKDFLFMDNAGSDAGSVEVVFTNGLNETARLQYEVPIFQGIDFLTGGDFDGDGKFELLGHDQISDETFVTEVIGGSSSSQTLMGSNGIDIIDGQGGNDRIFGKDGDDLLLGNVGTDTIFGGDGIDRIDGGTEDDTLFGQNGNDIIQGQSGDDLLDGGAGDDFLKAGNGTDVLLGGEGDDYLLGGSFGFDHMKGGEGNDVLQGQGDRTLMEGENGNDVLMGSSSLDVMFGGNGNDVLIGGLSLDTLFGGAGDDIIIGVDVAGTSGTDDILYGGGGKDFFYLGNDDGNYYTGSGEATIKDFFASPSSSSGDHLMLNGSSSNYTFVDLGATIEIRQSSDANVIAILETTATVASIQESAIYIG